MTLSDLKQNSYVPYSQDANCAVIESKQGNYFPGVRIENSAFPLIISAIKNAVFCCLSEREDPVTLYLTNRNDPVSNFLKQEYNLTLETINRFKNQTFSSILHSVSDIRETLQQLLVRTLVNHSHFPVSALLETDGGFVTGVNIENSAWSCGLCAERVAIAKAISYGIKEFKSLHVCTKYGEYSSPCGACRQVIIEHLSHHRVHLYHPDGTTSTHFSSDLLPCSFQSSSLNKCEF